VPGLGYDREGDGRSPGLAPRDFDAVDDLVAAFIEEELSVRR
jgi:hypothetical protein